MRIFNEIEIVYPQDNFFFVMDGPSIVDGHISPQILDKYNATLCGEN